jgi:hypothetical protein
MVEEGKQHATAKNRLQVSADAKDKRNGYAGCLRNFGL